MDFESSQSETGVIYEAGHFSRGRKVELVNGYKVKNVTWDKKYKSLNGELTNELTDEIKLTAHNSAKILSLGYTSSCCEISYFATYNLHNLVDETIINIDIDKDREHNIDVIYPTHQEFLALNINRNDLDRAEMVDDRLKFYQLTNDCVDIKVYVIRTESGKEVSLPLITVSNGCYSDYLIWSFN